MRGPAGKNCHQQELVLATGSGLLVAMLSQQTLTSHSPASAPLISVSVIHNVGVSITLTATAGTPGEDEWMVNSPTQCN